MKYHLLKQYQKFVQVTQLVLNSVEWFESVVLFSPLNDDKLSNIAKLIRQLTQPDTSVEYFVLVHEQSPFEAI